MIDMFRHDLDREQTYLVLRALDSHIENMNTLMDDMSARPEDRAAARVEAGDSHALRVMMSRGL